MKKELNIRCFLFLLTPLRERRPAGRVVDLNGAELFLLTPLREGRLEWIPIEKVHANISTHAPAGGATLPCDGRI